MNNGILKSINKLEKREEKLLGAHTLPNPISDKLYSKVPDGLRNTLEAAFAKAFEVVFSKGTGVIEKTFNKENIDFDFDVNDYAISKKGSARNIRRMDKYSGKSNMLNNTITTATGIGLGALGIGLPDIPLMVATMLKGVYETAASYGFDYTSTEERIYILRLVRTALATGGEKEHFNSTLDGMDYSTDLSDEMKLTAKVLSDQLLVSKFLQGIPIVGVVGGAANHTVYKKVSDLASVKYKKRYLLSKL